MAAPKTKPVCRCPICHVEFESKPARRHANKYCAACYVGTFEPDQDIDGHGGQIDDENAWSARIERITARLRDVRLDGTRGGGQAGGPSPAGFREYAISRSGKRFAIDAIG